MKILRELNSNTSEKFEEMKRGKLQLQLQGGFNIKALHRKWVRYNLQFPTVVMAHPLISLQL